MTSTTLCAAQTTPAASGPNGPAPKAGSRRAPCKTAFLLTLAVAGVAGCIIVGLGGHTWGLVLIGMICVVFAFLYSTLLSYCGMGDVLVWTFFGFIPVLGTYYAQARFLTPEAWIVAAGCGLAIDCLLIVNNYRDRETDRQSDKRTLIVALGARFGERFLPGPRGVGLLVLRRFGAHQQ